MSANHRVFIVEDETSQSGPMKSMLEYRGFHVECADNGPSAVAMISSFQPHLVIVDLLLVSHASTMDGFDVIAALRESVGPDIGILVWTSHFVSPRDEIRALRAGADDYVRKDAEFGLIEARIEALIRRVVRIQEVLTIESSNLP